MSLAPYMESLKDNFPEEHSYGFSRDDGNENRTDEVSKKPTYVILKLLPIIVQTNSPLPPSGNGTLPSSGNEGTPAVDLLFPPSTGGANGTLPSGNGTPYGIPNGSAASKEILPPSGNAALFPNGTLPSGNGTLYEISNGTSSASFFSPEVPGSEHLSSSSDRIVPHRKRKRWVDLENMTELPENKYSQLTLRYHQAKVLVDRMLEWRKNGQIPAEVSNGIDAAFGKIWKIETGFETEQPSDIPDLERPRGRREGYAFPYVPWGSTREDVLDSLAYQDAGQTTRRNAYVRWKCMRKFMYHQACAHLQKHLELFPPEGRVWLKNVLGKYWYFYGELFI